MKYLAKYIFGLVFLFNSLISVASDTLTVGYYLSPPFITNNNGVLDGLNIKLWNKINADLHLPCKFVKIPLTGLLDSLSNGSIDISIAPLSITAQRSKVIDFSVPFLVSNSSVLVKHVSSFSKWMDYIFSFFSINFLRAVFALFLVVFIFGFFAWVFEHKKNPEEFKPGIRGFWSGIWWSAVTMTTVGYGDKSPKTLGGRIIGLIWMFASIIIISSFTASIASSLTVNQLSWHQSKIDDFKDKKIATVEASATHKFLEKRYFTHLSTYSDLNKCIASLLNNQVNAVAFDEPQLKFYVKNDTLDLVQTLDINFNTQLYAFGFKEELPDSVKELIDNKLLEVVESSEWKHMLLEYQLLKD